MSISGKPLSLYPLSPDPRQWGTGVESTFAPLLGTHTFAAFAGLAVSFLWHQWISCLWGALIKCTNRAAFPNLTLVLLWNARIFYHGKMLHALTLNKPTSSNAFLGGTRIPGCYVRRQAKKGLFLKGGNKGHPEMSQKCPANAPACLELFFVWRTWKWFMSLFPRVSDWLLKPETLKQVLSKISFHMDKKKSTWDKKQK